MGGYIIGLYYKVTKVKGPYYRIGLQRNPYNCYGQLKYDVTTTKRGVGRS